ncbi:hypothetical protein D3C80_1596830 [compost metagenome]
MHQDFLVGIGIIAAEVRYIPRIIDPLVNKVISQVDISCNIQNLPGFVDQIH